MGGWGGWAESIEGGRVGGVWGYFLYLQEESDRDKPETVGNFARPISLDTISFAES